jgi:hypothetical protein
METYRGFLCGLYPDMSPCRDKRVAGSATGGVSRDSAASNAATARYPGQGAREGRYRGRQSHCGRSHQETHIGSRGHRRNCGSSPVGSGPATSEADDRGGADRRAQPGHRDAHQPDPRRTRRGGHRRARAGDQGSHAKQPDRITARCQGVASKASRRSGRCEHRRGRRTQPGAGVERGFHMHGTPALPGILHEVRQGAQAPQNKPKAMNPPSARLRSRTAPVTTSHPFPQIRQAIRSHRIL